MLQYRFHPNGSKLLSNLANSRVLEMCLSTFLLDMTLFYIIAVERRVGWQRDHGYKYTAALILPGLSYDGLCIDLTIALKRCFEMQHFTRSSVKWFVQGDLDPPLTLGGILLPPFAWSSDIVMDIIPTTLRTLIFEKSWSESAVRSYL